MSLKLESFKFWLLSFLIVLPLLAHSNEVILNPLTIEQLHLSKTDLEPGQNIQLKIEIELAKDHYAYEDQFRIEIDSPFSVTQSKINIEPILKFYDKFSKKERTGVQNSAVIKTQLEIPDKAPAGEFEWIVRVHYQACTKAYCHLPKFVEKKLNIKISGESGVLNQTPTADNKNSQPDSTFSWKLLSFDEAKDRGVVFLFLFVLLAGILTSFTPCIFPMIPITLTVLRGHSQSHSKWEGFIRSWFYVLGISFTYTVMGLFAGLSGQLFGSWLSHPIVVSFFSIIFFAMALSMFGFFEIKPPRFIEKYLSKQGDSRSYSGIFLTGILAGVLASPCVGPVLVSILTFVAKTQDVVLGGGLLFTYAIGIGLLFIVIGTFSHSAQKKLPKSGPWMIAIKDLLGWSMTALALYYLKPILPATAWNLLSAIILISFSSVFGAFAHLQESKPWLALKKGWLLLLYVLGVLLFIRALWWEFGLPSSGLDPATQSSETDVINWQPYSEKNILRAQTEGKGVIIDFYADWCVACLELERFTFSKSEVQKLKDEFIWIKFDATKGSPEFDNLAKKYKIFGLPHLVFYNPKGQWIEKETLTGFEESQEFSSRLNRVLEAL